MHNNKSRWTLFALKSLISLMAVVVLGSCQSNSRDTACSARVHSAFDIGSGTTKLTVAEVDPCTPKIRKVLATDQVKVDYKEDLDRSPAKKFSASIRETGVKALGRLLNISQKYQPDEQSAVATAAFREAGNSEEFIKQIHERTGLRVQVISQNEEGRLGYFAAQAQLTSHKQPLLVWDIGGGSQQFIHRNNKGEEQVARNEWGSVRFKNAVIEKIHKKGASTGVSPNPLCDNGFQQALELARTQAALLPLQLKDWVASQRPLVAGIGGVHSKSVNKQTGSHGRYSRSDLKKALQTRIHQSDAEIGGDYASTDVTNLVLVLGFMEELGIETIEVVDVNLTDALLLNPSFKSFK